MTEPISILPYGRQNIDDDDIRAVVEALSGDYLTTGPNVDAFEERLGAFLAAGGCASCSNGTAALHLALLQAGIGPGDAVIVPSITFLASANAVRYVGAEVVFADVDADTALMMADHYVAALERADDKNIRAVMPVHIGGQCVAPMELEAVCRAHDVKIIEDATHALGTRYFDSSGTQYSVGECAHSDLAVFSFHPVKTMAMGEGGAVTSGSSVEAEQIRELRNHGMVRAPERFLNTEMGFDENGEPNVWYYEMQAPGYNFRITDIQCALGISQLKKLAGFIQRREHLRRQYEDEIEVRGLPLKPVPRVDNCEPGWHLFSVLIDFDILGKTRNKCMRELRDLGVGTQVHYIPVHKQPYYAERYTATPDLPGVEEYYRRTLSLPLFPGMEDRDVLKVLDALGKVLS